MHGCIQACWHTKQEHKTWVVNNARATVESRPKNELYLVYNSDNAYL